jgi:hypothetical protein
VEYKVGAAQSARQQHRVDVAHQHVEVLIADPLGVAKVRVPVGATDGDPTVFPPQQVGAEDDVVPLGAGLRSAA